MLPAPNMPEAEAPPSPPPAPPRPRFLKRVFRCALLLAAAWLVWHTLWIFLGGNFHTVIPGKVYRSAQPSPSQLDNWTRRHGIKTIINLRGCCALFPWYLEETKIAQDLGIAQEDIILSARRLPSASEIRLLAEALENAEQPILLHCFRGADRTGLASVLALVLLADAPYPTARAALGWRNGHLPLAGTENLDAFFDLYETSLQQSGQPHSRDRFRHWLIHEYNGGWCRQKFVEVSPSLTLRVGQQPGKASPAPDSESQATTASSTDVRINHPLAYRVKLQNPGPLPWTFRPHTVAGMHLGYEVFDENNKLVQQGRAGMLHRDVPPGETIDLIVTLRPLAQPGRYRLRLDMIEEGHCWFQQAGAEPHEEEFTIRE